MHICLLHKRVPGRDGNYDWSAPSVELCFISVQEYWNVKENQSSEVFLIVRGQYDDTGTVTGVQQNKEGKKQENWKR